MKKKLPVFAILVFLTAVSLGAAAEPTVDLREFSSEACPTGSAKYAVDITNPGNAPDTYQVVVDEEGSTVSEPRVEIGGGETETVYLWMQPPVSAQPGTYSFTADVTSSNTGETESVTGTLRVLSCRAVELSAAEPDQSVCLGETATYDIRVENTGQAEETFQLSADAGSLSRSEVTLGPGESTTVEMAAYSDQAASEQLVVTAESTTSYARGQTEVSFTAEQCRDMDVFVSPSQDSICEGETGEFSITVQNTGSVQDSYSLTTNVEGAEVPDLTLDPGESQTYRIAVNEGEGVHTVVARAMSKGFSGLTRTENAQLTVENCYDVTLLSQGNNSIQIGPENRTLLTLGIENSGTRTNTYNLTFDGPEWADLRPTETTLDPGERAPAFVYVAPDFFSEEGTYTSKLTVTDESGSVQRVVNIDITVGADEIVAEPDGEDEVEPGLSGGLVSRGTGLGIIILVLAALFIGGYWLFRRKWSMDEVQEPRHDGDEGNGDAPSGRSTGFLGGAAADEQQADTQDQTGTPVDRDQSRSAIEDVATRDTRERDEQRDTQEQRDAQDTTRDRDYYKSANDFLAQNRNTVRKALREDDFSKRFLDVLLEEERQDKNRTSVLNEIERQIDKKQENGQ